MTIAALKTAAEAAEARHDAACKAIKQARADLGRSKAKAVREAFLNADAEMEYATMRLRRANAAYHKALDLAERAAAKAAAAQPQTMEMFA